MKNIFGLVIGLIALTALCATGNFPIVDTGQSSCFDDQVTISAPAQGAAFYGQDAQYQGNQPSYTDNADGTISDVVTGLMWSKSCDTDGDGDIDYDDKMSFDEALASVNTVNIAGYSDWRIPTIKELYSLIQFSGIDPSGYQGSTAGLTPFIDTDYFDFDYGDESAGERIIDAQFVTTTLYVSTTMNGDETVFGVNFADGRIKGYGIDPLPGQTVDKQFYVYYVRDNQSYGTNSFVDNADGTITDTETGLMWAQADNGQGLTWQEALSYSENATLAGYSDWRLPNVKELQSIVDYTRAPDITNSPAIDPLFACTAITNAGGQTDYPYYWSGTTHENYTNENGSAAAYVSFGRALGWMEMPPNSGNYTLLDVHGAGAQRSDPKSGDPANYPHGHGPQGDVIRIYNYVRLVRDAAQTSSQNTLPNQQLQASCSNYPNPANPSTTITYSLPQQGNAELAMYSITGQKVTSLTQGYHPSGDYSVVWHGTDATGKPVSSGLYLYQLRLDGQIAAHNRCLVLK